MALSEAEWIEVAQAYASLAGASARLAAAYGPQGSLWEFYKQAVQDYQDKAKAALALAAATL